MSKANKQTLKTCDHYKCEVTFLSGNMRKRFCCKRCSKDSANAESYKLRNGVYPPVEVEGDEWEGKLPKKFLVRGEIDISGRRGMISYSN